MKPDPDLSQHQTYLLLKLGSIFKTKGQDFDQDVNASYHLGLLQKFKKAICKLDCHSFYEEDELF